MISGQESELLTQCEIIQVFFPTVSSAVSTTRTGPGWIRVGTELRKAGSQLPDGAEELLHQINMEIRSVGVAGD